MKYCSSKFDKNNEEKEKGISITFRLLPVYYTHAQTIDTIYFQQSLGMRLLIAMNQTIDM